MESWNIGPHLLEFEPPDIFHCHIRAPIEENEARETLRIVKEELGDKRGVKVFFVTHMEATGVTNMFTLAARKYLSSQSPDWKATVIVGGNAMTRAASNIVLTAMGLVSNRKIPFRMVKAIDEAREYIAELRKRESAQAPSKG